MLQIAPIGSLEPLPSGSPGSENLIRQLLMWQIEDSSSLLPRFFERSFTFYTPFARWIYDINLLEMGNVTSDKSVWKQFCQYLSWKINIFISWFLQAGFKPGSVTLLFPQHLTADLIAATCKGTADLPFHIPLRRQQRCRGTTRIFDPLDSSAANLPLGANSQRPFPSEFWCFLPSTSPGMGICVHLCVWRGRRGGLPGVPVIRLCSRPSVTRQVTHTDKSR